MMLLTPDYQPPEAILRSPTIIRDAYLRGLTLLIEEDLPDYERAWSEWCLSIHQNTQLERLNKLFFSKIPLPILQFQTDFLKSAFVLELASGDYPPEFIEWFEHYFDPMAHQYDLVAFNQALQQFNQFFECVNTQKLFENLGHPPTKSISFQCDDDQYFSKMLWVLQHAKNKTMQAAFLDKLPSLDLIENAFSAGLPFISHHMVCNNEVSVQSRAELVAECVDLDEFCARSLTLLAMEIGDEAPQVGRTFQADKIKRYKQWLLFIDQLQRCPTQKLTKSQQLTLAKCALQSLINPFENSELAQLITVAIQIKETIGINVFQRLFTANIDLPQHKLSHYLECCQLLLDLKDGPESHELCKKYLKSPAVDLEKLLDELKTVQETYLAKKYPQRDLNAVIAGFAEISALVQFPLSGLELEKIKAAYLKIQAAGIAFGRVSQDNIRLSDYHDDKYTTLYLITEMIRKQFKIAPYDTQLLSVLALLETPEKLKGRIAQIKTGEGKSTILAILAAYQAARGDFVDVITSTGTLARRDQKKYSPFFSSLGITSSHICYNGSDLKPEHFNAQILYGQNTDFEFAYMKDGVYNQKLLYSTKNGTLQPRTADTVIVDEADNLFLDTANNEAHLAIPSHEHIEWIYEPILAFVKQHMTDTQEPELLHVALLRQQLMQLHEGIHQALITNMPDERLLKFMDNAHSALYSYKESVDYVVKPVGDEGEASVNQVVIMDYDITGRSSQDSRWNDSLHQFLEVKHGLKPQAESLTVSSVTHANFFDRYRTIFGLTGTMGDPAERDEIAKIYHVDSFDVPQHFPSKRTSIPSHFDEDSEAHYATILAEIIKARQEGRPALILFKTVASSQAFSKYLETKGMKHQVLNEMQRESEDYIISRAGEPARIIVGTNATGRGTDIILPPESEKNGGLHVVFTFYPNNLRVEDQGFGRAGRQGQNGSCCMCLCAKDDYVQQLLQGAPFSSFEQLDKLREQQTIRQSKERLLLAEIKSLFFEKQEAFFRDIKPVYTLSENPEFLQRLSQQCQDFHLNSEHAAPINDNFMPRLRNQAAQLLKQARIDWTGFVKQFMDGYIEHILDTWAQFYSELNVHGSDENCGDVSTRLEMLHAKACKKLTPMLSTPELAITSCLKSVLSDAIFGLDENPLQHNLI